MAAFEDLIPEIVFDVAGCPVPLATRTFRNAAIDFFKRSESWVYQPTALPAVKGIPELDIDVPANTRVHRILTMDFKGRKLEPTSEVLLEDRVEGWRVASGNPKVFFKLPGDRVRISPTPTQTEPLALNLSVALTLTRYANSIDDSVLEEHYDALVTGTLGRLMAMRDQPWTNIDLASVYASQFQQATIEAKRNSRGDNTSKLRVTKYGGY